MHNNSFLLEGQAACSTEIPSGGIAVSSATISMIIMLSLSLSLSLCVSVFLCLSLSMSVSLWQNVRLYACGVRSGVCVCVCVCVCVSARARAVRVSVTFQLKSIFVNLACHLIQAKLG